MVSYSAWLHGVSCPQETVGKRFPVRLDSMVFHTDRKLFAYSFLFGLAPLHFISAGNYSRKVSCPTWHHSISYRQETFCEGFPIRLDSMLFLTPQETVREGFPIRLGSIAFLAHRKLFAGRFLDSARNDKRAWLHGAPYLQETFHSPSYPCKLSSCPSGSISLYLD